LIKKGIIFRFIFEKGCPVFVIAKTLGTSEAEVYRYLNGEKIPHESELKLKRLWKDLVKLHS
jgi:predicted transcriptional regulator